jgi:hypothetical protein
VCEMPDLQSLSYVRSPFVSAIVNLTLLERHFSATIQPFRTIEVSFSMAVFGAVEFEYDI